MLPDFLLQIPSWLFNRVPIGIFSLLRSEKMKRTSGAGTGCLSYLYRSGRKKFFRSPHTFCKSFLYDYTLNPCLGCPGPGGSRSRRPCQKVRRNRQTVCCWTSSRCRRIRSRTDRSPNLKHLYEHLYFVNLIQQNDFQQYLRYFRQLKHH